MVSYSPRKFSYFLKRAIGDPKSKGLTQSGRLMQVEYAIESINSSKTTVGILTKEGKQAALMPIGVVLGAERSEISKLLDISK